MPSDDILTLAPPAADQRISYGPARQQFGDLRLPIGKGPFPVVMNIHGGFWRAKYDLAHAGHLCAVLTAKGIATWSIEYRRVGDTGGGWPGTLEDVRYAYQHIAQLAESYRLDVRRVLVMGHSAGGQLAICLAAHESGVKQVVLLAGVVDLKRAWELHLSNGAVAELLGGSPAGVPDRYRDADPVQLAIPRDTVQFLIHGTNDDTVPAAFSRDYCDQKKKWGENVRYLEIASADHFDLINPVSQAWPKVETAVTDLLAL